MTRPRFWAKALVLFIMPWSKVFKGWVTRWLSIHKYILGNSFHLGNHKMALAMNQHCWNPSECLLNLMWLNFSSWRLFTQHYYGDVENLNFGSNLLAISKLLLTGRFLIFDAIFTVLRHPLFKWCKPNLLKWLWKNPFDDRIKDEFFNRVFIVKVFQAEFDLIDCAKLYPFLSRQHRIPSERLSFHHGQES